MKKFNLNDDYLSESTFHEVETNIADMDKFRKLLDDYHEYDIRVMKIRRGV